MIYQKLKMLGHKIIIQTNNAPFFYTNYIYILYVMETTYKLQKHTVLLYKKRTLIRQRYRMCVHRNVDTNYNRQYMTLLKDIRGVINNTNIARFCNCKLCRNVCIDSWDEIDDILKEHEDNLQQIAVGVSPTLNQKEIVARDINVWDVKTIY